MSGSIIASSFPLSSSPFAPAFSLALSRHCRLPNPELVPSLKEEGTLGGFRRSRLRNALVVLQIALSLVLLISAGLIVRSLQAAQHLRPGFNPHNAVALSFDVALQGYEEPKGRAFYTRVPENSRHLPGVTCVALADSLPLSLDYSSVSMYVEGQAPASSSDLPTAVAREVSPDYFQTMGVPLRGRDFRPNENKTEYGWQLSAKPLPIVFPKPGSDRETLQLRWSREAILADHRRLRRRKI